MNARTLLGYIFIFICFLGASEAYAVDEVMQCNDVTKIDFPNTKVDTGKEMWGIFDFHKGHALQYFEGIQEPPEWEATIQKDQTIHLENDQALRFLLIHNNHLGGSGWRFYLVGFSCSKGVLRRVFEKDGMSLEIAQMDSKAVVIRTHAKSGSEVWKYFSYHWNKKTQNYGLNSTWWKK